MKARKLVKTVIYAVLVVLITILARKHREDKRRMRAQKKLSEAAQAPTARPSTR